MGLKFVVDENVLIPRQDTEFVVEEAMRYIQDSTSILDMCTGSGCIILSLLHYTNHCTGVAVDISEKALEVAKENAKVLKEERVTFVQSDLFCNVDKAKKFDYIISNPPYIESAVIQTLEPEVKKYEPLLALDGMEDGMHFYRQIIEQAPKYLNRGGMLFLEIGYNQAESVKQLLEEANFIQIQVKKDYAGLERMVFATFLEERNV